jgi:hypothetical protein
MRLRAVAGAGVAAAALSGAPSGTAWIAGRLDALDGDAELRVLPHGQKVTRAQMPVARAHPRAHARRVDPEPSSHRYAARPDLDGSVDALEPALDEVQAHLAHPEADSRALGHDAPRAGWQERSLGAGNGLVVADSGRRFHAYL